MKANYTVDSYPPERGQNYILVNNNFIINEIWNFAVKDYNKYEKKDFIGVWKLKIKK